MSMVFKVIRQIEFCFTTIISKIRWRGLRVDGLFRKRIDTQIILSEEGKMIIGKKVRFQRNVALTSVGGN